MEHIIDAYAERVKRGDLDIEQVPERFREQVRSIVTFVQPK